MEDSMTREVSALASAGASSVSFKNPARALITGEWFTFSGHSTEYRVTSSTSSAASFTPVLTSGVADNETITRYDKYAVITADDWLEEMGIEVEDDPKKTFAYKKILSARSMIEQKLGSPIVSRSFTETYSVSSVTQRIQLLRAPVISVSEVTFDDTTVSSNDYEIEDATAGILFRESFWPKGENHIGVTYTAGWTYPEFEFRELFFQVTSMLMALSPSGKDILIIGSNNAATGAVNQEIRSLSDIETFIDKWLMRYRVMYV